MVRALGAALVLVTLASTAYGQEPARAPAAPPATPECAPPARTADAAAEERAFSAELERFARLRAFTERLVAQREAEAFEQAALRQTRVAQLKRELTEREAALSQRELDDAVALYLKKLELTRGLVAAARAKGTPAGAASAPVAPRSPTTPAASSP